MSNFSIEDISFGDDNGEQHIPFTEPHTRREPGQLSTEDPYTELPHNTWVVYIDGLYDRYDSNIGCVLISLSGEKIEKAI